MLLACADGRHVKSSSDEIEHKRRQITAGNSTNDALDVGMCYESKILKFSDMLCGSLENEKKTQPVPRTLGGFSANEEGLATL